MVWVSTDDSVGQQEKLCGVGQQKNPVWCGSAEMAQCGVGQQGEKTVLCGSAEQTQCGVRVEQTWITCNSHVMSVNCNDCAV